MKNKLILNERVQNFLEDDNKLIWNLILEDKVDTLLESSFTEDIDLSKILQEFFAKKRSETLDSYDFSVIKEGNSTFFRNLVKLIFALNINGNHNDLEKIIENKLFEGLPSFIEKVQNEVAGYPMRKVDEGILAEAATVRTSLMSLIYFYRETDDIENLHSAIMMRTKITLVIMANHKHILGYDMVEAARIKEQMGETDMALSFYNAARDNLKGELHWFLESPEIGPNEDDVVMLQALKESLLSIDRLRNISESEKTCAIIDEILSREYVDVFEGFDDEDEED
ncbi:MAG: hypothetical protein ACK5KT_09950 [Dysgonomonas sp.]